MDDFDFEMENILCMGGGCAYCVIQFEEAVALYLDAFGWD